MNNAYAGVDKVWRDVAKIVLGAEVGELSEYEDWLTEFSGKLLTRKSSISGKEVSFSVPHYSKGAKIASLEEIDLGKKFDPLNINEIKDFDSIISAVKERVQYTGNVVLGNSSYVDGSSSVSNSHFIYKSSTVDGSKYVAHSTYVRFSERAIACTMLGRGNEYVIRVQMARLNKRCFEIWWSNECADCFYSAGIDGCHDCMFSFNLHSKGFRIGNCELSRDKYTKVRKHLREQMAKELETKKRLPSLFDIIGRCKNKPPIVKSDKKYSLQAKERDKKIMEDSFTKTSSLVLGKPLSGMDNYSEWLDKNILGFFSVSSAMSKKQVLLTYYPHFDRIPKYRMVSLDEAYAIGEQKKISESDALSIDWNNIADKIGQVAFITSEKLEGICENLIDCPIVIDSVNCYRCSPCVEAKNCGFCFWPRNSEYIFGSHITLQSSFCLKCHNSVRLRGCFECDSCYDCSNCYYCHNCENVRDSMFCFNVKNKQYAIGNSEVGREKYLQIKKIVLDEILRQIKEAKKPKIDIYQLGT